MLKLILRLLAPAFAAEAGRNPRELPSHLSLREMADIPPHHPSADCRS